MVPFLHQWRCSWEKNSLGYEWKPIVYRFLTKDPGIILQLRLPSLQQAAARGELDMVWAFFAMSLDELDGSFDTFNRLV